MIQENGHSRRSSRKNLVPLRLGKHRQRHGEEKCKDKNDGDLDGALLLHAEEHNDWRYQQ